MEILDSLLVGAVVSLLVQGVKKYFGTSEYATLAVVVVLSLVGAGVYQAFKDTAFWPVFVQTLTYAGAVFAFLLQRFRQA